MSPALRLLAGAAALALLAPAQASATGNDYIAKFCADGACANPTTERMAMRPTWDALTAAGTSAFVGGSIDNVRLDPASLVAGARMLGVPALDGLLRTGQVPFSGPDARRAALQRMATVQGVDINSEIGLPPSARAATRTGMRDAISGAPFAGGVGGVGAAGAASTLAAIVGIPTAAGSGMPNVNSVNGCDANLERMQIASAANTVQNMSTLATSSAGFTRMDGQGALQSITNEIGNGGRPMSAGFTGMNCLANLFQFGNLDLMFQPPLMGNMMNQLANMRCQAAAAGAAGLMAMLPTNAFQTLGMGGFRPGLNLSQYAGGLNGAGMGNFTGVANLAMSLGGGSMMMPMNPNVPTIGALYGR